jgi:conjugal transfer pilus assembly protein TraV
MNPMDDARLTMRLAPRIAAGLSALALAGCANMAGIGGSAEFGCKAPVGVKCDSVSGTYYNALQQNLPSQQKTPPPKPDASGEPSVMDRLARKNIAPTAYATTAAPAGKPAVTTLALTKEANAPLRSPARVLRLWIKPWEDSDGDLHSPSYVYVPIDAGRWLIDHTPRPERSAYAPIKAPGSLGRASAMPSSATSGDAPRSAQNGTTLSRPWGTAILPASTAGQGVDDGK